MLHLPCFPGVLALLEIMMLVYSCAIILSPMRKDIKVQRMNLRIFFFEMKVFIDESHFATFG
jgi:hypothetical protein